MTATMLLSLALAAPPAQAPRPPQAPPVRPDPATAVVTPRTGLERDRDGHPTRVYGWTRSGNLVGFWLPANATPEFIESEKARLIWWLDQYDRPEVPVRPFVLPPVQRRPRTPPVINVGFAADNRPGTSGASGSVNPYPAANIYTAAPVAVMSGSIVDCQS